MTEKKSKEKKEAIKKPAKISVEKKVVHKKVVVKTAEAKPAKEKKAAVKTAAKTKSPASVKVHEKASVAETKTVAEVKAPAAKPAVAVHHKNIPVAPVKKEAPPVAPVVEKKPEAGPVHKSVEVPKPAVAPVAEKPKAKVEAPVTQAPKVVVPPPPPVKPVVEIRFPITVGDLAQRMNRRIPEVIKALMGIGIFANVNQLLNEEIVFAAGEVLGIEIKKMADEAKAIIESGGAEDQDASKLKSRPPVVTMMGHVDHGKTSLLDAIRNTNVASKEKGFITQHIGAYGVDIPGKGHVTFLDTPGHEAFTAMRARGANVTDVVVLVVAADDGVMPQTIEAIDHAREAGCPIVVAMNKIDLPVANPAKVMGELQKIGLVPEEWGGKTIVVKVSAKTGKGIEDLLGMLLLEAEVLELKANPDRLAVGVVIESHISKGSGPVASVIVQKGTLRLGDIVVAGPYTGKIRAMKNDHAKTVREAGPAYAVELSGLNGVPEAG
ncbi:MAG: translation initiation factor IF-2, partial [Candidatus Omnitrophica bacterium]|nr:translation initiation factor IF-2 [Candidatus Omnitrophota bacterium]